MDRELKMVGARACARWLVLLGLVWCVCSACVVYHGEMAAGSREEAIAASARDFTAAFNRGDATALACMWTERGEIVDERGVTYKGRMAIERAYADLFRQYPGAKMDIEIRSIEFPTERTAVERGSSKTTGPAGQSVSGDYTAVHVLRGGKWLMTTVREAPSAAMKTSMGSLNDLQWLIGKWQAKKGKITATTNAQWVAGKHFIRRSYRVMEDGVTTASGVQVIGWDPQAGQVRSWTFDSSGGHGTGFWTPTPTGWRIATFGTLANGTPISATDFLVRVPGNDSVCGWRSCDRMVGSMRLPDIREAVFDRVAEKR